MWDCCAEELEYLDDMGFNVPNSSMEAQVFSEYFHNTDFHHRQIPMNESYRKLMNLNLSFWRRTGLIGDLKKHEEHLRRLEVEYKSALVALTSDLTKEKTPTPVTFSTGGNTERWYDAVH